MVEKKNYVKPQVESEEAVEQTSLACTSTMFPYYGFCDWGTNLVTTVECETIPWKGGSFNTTVGCSAIPAEAYECIVALS